MEGIKKTEDFDGIYVGRFNPFHLGHQRIVNEMLKMCTIHNSLIIIGSSNIHAPTLRNFFTYLERRRLIKKIFPLIKLVGLPDYNDDDEMWFTALDDILDLANIHPHKAIYFGGCEQDVDYFIKRKRRVYIVNRFNYDIEISGTKIRDYLIHKKPLTDLVDPIIIPDVKEIFNSRWPEILNF